MDLSPNDIRNQEFSNKMRGYDKEDVDNFLEKVAEALENARQENLKLSMEIDSLNTQITGLKQFEDTIKNAAIDARRNADLTIANAKKEADLILSSANGEAVKLVGTRTEQISELEKQIADLELTKKSFISKIRGMINTHMDLVDETSKADIRRNLTGDDINVTESSDITRDKFETVATKPEDKTITTEEANAAGAIVQASDGNKLDEQKGTDPELEAALEIYKSQKTKADEKAAVNMSTTDIHPKPGEFVETTKSAEDIPEGFIAKDHKTNNNTGKEIDTDKVKISPDVQDNPMEHNNIDIDQSVGEPQEKKKITPNNISEELDSVVEKFVEEIDKAEKR